MTFDSLVQFLLEQHKIKNLTKDVRVKDISKEMSNVEKLFPYYIRQSAEDLEEDSRKSGFLGYGVFDEKSDKIEGYIFGHDMQEDDYHFLSMLDLEDIIFYDNDFRNLVLSMFHKTKESFFRKLLHKNSIYVANLVVTPQYRSSVYRLINSFVNECRDRNIKYLLFNALPDTIRLIKSNRLSRYNIRNIAELYSDDDSKFYLLEI